MKGMKIDTQIWTENTVADGKNVSRSIVKIPQIPGMPVQQGAVDQYIVMDQTLGTTEVEGVDSEKLEALSKEYQLKVTDFINNYITQLNPGFEVAKLKGSIDFQGKRLPVYQVKLTDASFKALLKYCINDLMQNEDAITLVKDLLLSTLQITELTETDAEAVKAEIDKAFEEYKNQLPELRKQVDAFFDAFKDVQLIGSSDLVLNYVIDENGYIVYEYGTIDIVIDTKAILDAVSKLSGEDAAEAGETLATEDTGTLRLIVNYGTKRYNINKKVSISIPKVDETNSIKLDDLTGLIPGMSEEMPVDEGDFDMEGIPEGEGDFDFENIPEEETDFDFEDIPEGEMDFDLEDIPDSELAPEFEE